MACEFMWLVKNLRGGLNIMATDTWPKPSPPWLSKTLVKERRHKNSICKQIFCILNIITKQQSLGRFQKDVLSISDRSLCRLTLIWKFGFDWPPFVVKRINNNFWNAHKLNLPYRLAVKASGNPIIFYAKIKYLRLESIFQCKNSPGGGGGTPGSSWWVGAACSPNPHQKMSFSKPVLRPDL